MSIPFCMLKNLKSFLSTYLVVPLVARLPEPPSGAAVCLLTFFSYRVVLNVPKNEMNCILYLCTGKVSGLLVCKWGKGNVRETRSRLQSWSYPLLIKEKPWLLFNERSITIFWVKIFPERTCFLTEIFLYLGLVWPFRIHSQYWVLAKWVMHFRDLGFEEGLVCGWC